MIQYNRSADPDAAREVWEKATRGALRSTEVAMGHIPMCTYGAHTLG